MILWVRRAGRELQGFLAYYLKARFWEAKLELIHTFKDGKGKLTVNHANIYEVFTTTN